ncbi:MAG: FecR domain-containing protein [Bacteroidia bacterium]|nr:FecR domain-containing protein [Bacteroidia bacterium]
MTNIELLLDNWKKNKLNPKERLELLQMLEGAEGEDRFKEFWNEKWESDPQKNQDPAAVNLRLQQIHSEIKAQIQEEKRSNMARRIFYMVSIAAALILLIIGTWFVFEFSNNSESNSHIAALQKVNEVQVGRGGRLQQVALPDGSKVWLNVDSKLRYPLAFNDTVRQVWLEGEAYFEVEEDSSRPFIVSSTNLNTRVLGTSFYVSAYPDLPEKVSLATGKVKVDNGAGQEAILSPGEQLISDPQKEIWAKGSVDLASMGNWREGLLDFERIPLGELGPTLERWYGVKIIFDTETSKDCWIYGRPSKESIWGILKSFKDIRGISYRLGEDNAFHISGGECSLEGSKAR